MIFECRCWRFNPKDTSTCWNSTRVDWICSSPLKFWRAKMLLELHCFASLESTTRQQLLIEYVSRLFSRQVFPPKSQDEFDRKKHARETLLSIDHQRSASRRNVINTKILLASLLVILGSFIQIAAVCYLLISWLYQILMLFRRKIFRWSLGTQSTSADAPVNWMVIEYKASSTEQAQEKLKTKTKWWD